MKQPSPPAPYELPVVHACRQVRELPEAEALLAGFPRQDALGKEGFEAALRRWNADFIQRVSGWVGGEWARGANLFYENICRQAGPAGSCS